MQPGGILYGGITALCAMLKKYFRNKKIFKETDFRELTPFRLCEHEENEDGTITLLVPKSNNPIVVRWLLPRVKKPHMKLDLDEIGTATWHLIDGEKTVSGVAQGLSGKFGDRVEPLYERLGQFLTQLWQSKIISFQELNDKGEEHG